MIHARHSSVSIYYCRFPNQYLSEISQYGNHFLAKHTFTDKIKLFRTNKYSPEYNRTRRKTVMVSGVWTIQGRLSVQLSRQSSTLSRNPRFAVSVLLPGEESG